jgi:alkylhydroperoxidase family enzyme
MTTLRKPQVSDFSVEDLSTLERIANRTGQRVEQLLTPGIFGVQAHWPGWLEANLDHSLATYLSRGTLTQLAKEAMHVGVSMTNHCEY